MSSAATDADVEPRGPRIGVVDYGAGNLVSIEQALTSLGARIVIIRRAVEVDDVDGLVVPGVGAAGPAMRRLTRAGLVEPLRAWLAADRPFLGICLGLQLLFEGSDEDGAVTLGVLAGRTTKLASAPTLPHIGWNQVDQATGPTADHPLFAGIQPGADFYFVHSYAGLPNTLARPDVTLATTQHGARFVSAVGRGRTLGVQFHPERSGADGLRLLGNFLDLVRAAREAPASRPLAAVLA